MTLGDALYEMTGLLPTVLSLLFGGVGGGVLVRWWAHKREERKEGDNVALDLVQTLSVRVDVLEKQNSELRHDLRDVEVRFEAMILAIEMAPEKAGEIVSRVRAIRMGTKRQAAQVAVSAERVKADARDGKL